MCGILGALEFNEGVSPERFESALNLLAHRGPDGHHVWQQGPCRLGHRRLKIIDLSDQARQPMSDPSGCYHMVFNGEIYNYRELRDELEAQGHTFVSTSDSEVLLRMYVVYGQACLERLVGMFAFAIWDSQAEQLFAARDRAGQKPFLYAQWGHNFYFASEIRALQALLPGPLQVDPEALIDVLHWQGVLAPRTWYKEIARLPPAHVLEFSKGHVSLRRYWSLPRASIFDITRQEASEKVRSLTEHAVSSQCVADVPVGCFLSGGVDSSIVAAEMKRFGVSPLHTFSIGVADATLDESGPAAAFAKHLGSVHHAEVIDEAQLERWTDLITHLGEPFADASLMASDAVVNLAKPYVTVVLNGDGGDEVFGGYPKYQTLMAAKALQGIPRPLRQAIGRMLPKTSRLTKLFSPTGLSYLENYYNWTGHFSHEGLASHLSDTVLNQVDLEGRRRAFIEAMLGFDDVLESASHWDFQNYLGSILLHKMDMVSMLHGLEARSPFLDHRLVEFVFSLPTPMRATLWGRKRVLKTAFEARVGHEVFQRRKKGFSIPLSTWLKRRPLTDPTRAGELFHRLDFAKLSSMQQLNAVTVSRFQIRACHALIWAIMSMMTP